MRHYLSLITVAVLHVSAKWRTAHHLTKGKSRMFELIIKHINCVHDLHLKPVPQCRGEYQRHRITKLILN